jgi:rSAM/selenodomain-associated transferase 1
MRHLLLFGKLPRLGRVKTRLVPPLSPVDARRLYRAFLDDQLRFLRGFESWARIAWWTDDEPGPAGFTDLSLDGIDVCLQAPGNLGTRLLHAFEQTRSVGPGPIVIIGADSPTLPAEHVRAAFAALEAGAAAVIAPAADGGYVLVGMTEPRRELFADVSWGGAEVAATTRRRAQEIGIELAEIAPWYDVDEVQTLHRLREETDGLQGAERAPETARCLVDLELPPMV